MTVTWRGGGDNTVVYDFTKHTLAAAGDHLPEVVWQKMESIGTGNDLFLSQGRF